MTDQVTPLREKDCGQLCGSLCCTDWTPGVGLYLYPGEQLLLAEEPWLHNQNQQAEPTPEGSSNQGNRFIICDENCPRHLRPFACRTFPLTAHLNDSGQLNLVLDKRGQMICPLVQSGMPEILSAQFKHIMKRVWQRLLCIEEIRTSIIKQSRFRR